MSNKEPILPIPVTCENCGMAGGQMTAIRNGKLNKKSGRYSTTGYQHPRCNPNAVRIKFENTK